MKLIYFYLRWNPDGYLRELKIEFKTETRQKSNSKTLNRQSKIVNRNSSSPAIQKLFLTDQWFSMTNWCGYLSLPQQSSYKRL